MAIERIDEALAIASQYRSGVGKMIFRPQNLIEGFLGRSSRMGY
jgi:hypothetical protein